VAYEEVLEIGLPASAKDLLLFAQRPNALHRNEQQRENQKLEHEIVESRREGPRLVGHGLDFTVAHHRRDQHRIVS
jgi:hypothetical protein